MNAVKSLQLYIFLRSCSCFSFKPGGETSETLHPDNVFSYFPAVSALWRQVVRVRPNDKDAKMKYQECNKIVKQKAFERAIASDETKKSVVDSLDIESMSTFPVPRPD